MDVEVARVDHEIGACLHRIEHLPLQLDRFGDRPCASAPTGWWRRRRVVALQQLGGRRRRGTGCAPDGRAAQPVDRVEQMVVVPSRCARRGPAASWSCPALASSTNFSISVTGRLSTTNQPRSSRIGRRLRTPGAGQPGDDDARCSLLARWPCHVDHCVHAASFVRRSLRTQEDSRGIVAASRVLVGRAEEAGGRRGLGHVAHVNSPAAARALT